MTIKALLHFRSSDKDFDDDYRYSIFAGQD
ncbi:MAG: hypothetical protein H6Q76_506, partial [Firmicutes bacterium]|nr:hypothetical protein [Bacillota bacterium]